MTQSMRDFWNSRYGEMEFAYGETPNVFLTEQAYRLKDGSPVLVVGDGEGRNGVWLAERKLQVTSIDYSASGVEKAQALAKKHDVSFRAICQDLTTWNWPVEQFDGVISIFLHFPPDVRTTMHRSMLNALKPNGFFILEAFNPRQLEYKSGGPQIPAMLYTKENLLSDFQDADILLLEETNVVLNEGLYHVGEGAVIRLVAKKRIS